MPIPKITIHSGVHLETENEVCHKEKIKYTKLNKSFDMILINRQKLRQPRPQDTLLPKFSHPKEMKVSCKKPLYLVMNTPKSC